MRISWLAAAIGVLLMTATGQGRADDFTLKVANYGGVFTAAQKKYAGDLFTQRTGIKVEYIDANGADHLAKMLAARGREPPYDVVYWDQNIQERAIAAGVIDKLDPALVPNLKYVYDEAKNPQGYGPGMVFFSNGIAYNTEKFKEAGIPEPTSWNDLWDPRLDRRIAVPDLSISMGQALLVAAERLSGGDESTPEKGIAKLATLKAQSHPTSSATIESLFRSGDIWVTPWVNGRAWAMIDAGFPMRYVMPKEGGFGNQSVIDLVHGTKHPKEAEAYINLVLDPLPQLGQAHEVPYGPTNQVLAPVLAAYPEMAKKFPSSPDDIKRLQLINWAKFNASYAKAVDLWNREVVSK